MSDYEAIQHLLGSLKNASQIFFPIRILALDTIYKSRIFMAVVQLLISPGGMEEQRRILKVDEAHCNNNENDVQTISHTKAETPEILYCVLYLVFFTQHLLGKLCHIPKLQIWSKIILFSKYLIRKKKIFTLTESAKKVKNS